MSRKNPDEPRFRICISQLTLEIVGRMESESKRTGQPGKTTDRMELSGEPDFSTLLRPITEFAGRPDYPECLIGQHVDIGGYVGVVVAIVRNSIRVKSPEGFTRSFNIFTLRRLYGPPPEPEPIKPEPTPEATPPEKPGPRRDVIEEPNFDQPIVPISELVVRPDFPKCALGKHVDIAGYAGVVVELVNESLKVRSRQGTSRNYNAPILRKIHGPQKTG